MASQGSAGRSVEKTTRYVILIAAIVLALMITGFVAARIFGVLLPVFYVAIIVLASLLIISTVLLIYALLTALQTLATMRDEVNPMLLSLQHTVEMVTESADETTEAVKGTTRSATQAGTTISSTVKLATQYTAVPTVRAVGVLLGGLQMVHIFFGKGHARNRYEDRREQQLELLDEHATSKGE
jgi:hypothetical protein